MGHKRTRKGIAKSFDIMKEDIKNTSIDLIASDIKETLVGNGFVLSRTNPFFDWIHGTKTNICRPEDLGLSFYISNPPVSHIAPFDCTMAFINFESAETEGIYFQLTFYFHNALETCLDADDIHAVYDRHNALWFPKLVEYCSEIEELFHLTWETEYDESIEDNLYGRFPLEVAGYIPDIIKTLKLQYGQRKYTDSVTSMSDLKNILSSQVL